MRTSRASAAAAVALTAVAVASCTWAVSHAATIHKDPHEAFRAAGLSFHHHVVSTSGRIRRVNRVARCQETMDGDGANVCRAIGSQGMPRLDPFLMLDHFHVSKPGGFPSHPHRGFETVTYMLKGAFEHKDSHGHKGIIKAGDVQWMTAGSGVIHSEMPATDGLNTGMQLWVNLPAHKKMAKPRYQPIEANQIPGTELVTQAGTAHAKVIAGSLQGTHGPAHATTPIMLADVTLEPHTHLHIPVLQSQGGFVYVIEGEGYFGGDVHGTDKEDADIIAGRRVSDRSLGRLGSAGSLLQINPTADEDADPDSSDTDDFVVSTITARVRFFWGMARPIGEPVAARGPFVMNTQEELRQAAVDYQSGTLVRPYEYDEPPPHVSEEVDAPDSDWDVMEL